MNNLGRDEELISDPALLGPFTQKHFGCFISAVITGVSGKDMRRDMAYYALAVSMKFPPAS